jgi:hypothetical protein
MGVELPKGWSTDVELKAWPRGLSVCSGVCGVTAAEPERTRRRSFRLSDKRPASATQSVNRSRTLVGAFPCVHVSGERSAEPVARHLDGGQLESVKVEDHFGGGVSAQDCSRELVGLMAPAIFQCCRRDAPAATSGLLQEQVTQLVTRPDRPVWS